MLGGAAPDPTLHLLGDITQSVRLDAARWRRSGRARHRRSIVFGKATKNPHRRKLYCKANIADPTGEKNRISTTRGERGSLPRWFDYFLPHMRLKDTVTTTAGGDGQTQIVLVSPDDHKRMIRVFFAQKVWVMQEKFRIL